MNNIFQEWLDNFVIVYIDEILISSKLVTKHLGILERCSKS
jgi:hypothetical protein